MSISMELENVIRTTCYSLPPLLLAGLGGIITSKVGILNLGLEGMMLLGAFAAVIINFFTGSSMIGLLAAVGLGCLLGWIFAVFWLALAITGILGFIIRYTTWGLRIRATGLNDTAVNTAGVNPTSIRFVCLTISGGFCGMAGAYLSTSYLAMFTNGMTSGRGFLGNIASIMGNRTALGTFLGSLLFSATDGVTMKIQTSGFPSQLIQLIPYLLAFAVIIVNAVAKRRQ